MRARRPVELLGLPGPLQIHMHQGLQLRLDIDRIIRRSMDVICMHDAHARNCKAIYKLAIVMLKLGSCRSMSWYRSLIDYL